MLTAEEITLAYRLFLGRNPESQEVVTNLMQNARDYQQLRTHFLSSHEFIQAATEFIGEQQNIRIRHQLLPRIPVQIEVSASELKKMFERVHEEWEILGVKEPYWSVLTQEQYRPSHFSGHEKEFFQSGSYPADAFHAALRRNQIDPHRIRFCLDVGCGVARVTCYLAKLFPQVVGVDISSAHLDIARSIVRDGEVDNVTFIHCEDFNSYEKLPKVDGIFSIITLQHNPPPVMVWLLKELLGKLNPLGVAYIQIPVYRNGYFFEAHRYLNSPMPESLEMHFLPQNEIFKLLEACGCTCLEVREDGMVAEEHFTISNTFLIQKN